MPNHLVHLNDCIEDELEPQQQTLDKTSASISQIAKLRTLYVQKQGAVMSMRNGQIRVSHKGQELQCFPAATIDTIWLFGNVHPTIAVIKHCLTHAIPIILLSQAGQRCGAFGFETQNNPELLQAQVFEQSDSARCLKHVRFFISQKLNNQLQLLKRWNKQGLPLDPTCINGLINARNSVAECNHIDQLRGYEGIGARFYFQQWKTWSQHTWHFSGRNRRPPKDPINVLLSFGYQLLFNNIQVILEVRGISPLFGYLHKQANGFPSLVLDLMEPWRPLVVDEVVLKLILRQTLKASDFVQTDQGCILLERGKKIFVQAFEQRMQQRFTHPDLKIKTDLRRFIDLQVLELRQLLLTKDGSLTPLRLR
uniref:CRISPR-associated endonuclease Cas1 n=1 Tax=Vibrio alfacsensis TaxID=1074311 RepID=UPI002342E6F7|nr:CRISPR-associated endonuclease Cas1 [Vibrio alfacsensis]